MKKASFGAAVITGVLLLSGCGMSSAASDSQTSDSAASGPIKGEITFDTLQLKPTFTTYINGVIADFEKKYPGTKVNWVDLPFDGVQEKIVSDAQAGSLADVINLNPNFAQPLEASGTFVDLDQQGVDGTPYVKGAWDGFTVPGKEGHYAYPWYLTSEVTMYNKDLLAKSGLDPNKPPTTMDELASQAETISKAGAGQWYGLHPALENKFMVDLAKLGVPLMNKDATKWTFNTPEAVSYVEKLTQMYKNGVMPPDSLTEDHSKETEDYQAGQIALFPSGPNFLTIVNENAPAIAKVTGVAPQITGPNNVANMSVMGLLVPQTSKNKATALAFADFMTNATNQLGFSKVTNVLPSTTASLSDPYFTDDSDGTVDSQARVISAEQIKSAQNLLPVQFDDQVKQIVIGKVQLAMQGQLSAKAALDQAVSEANAATATHQ